MAHRKGLGAGRGKGFKNILPQDSFTHQLSAMGVKSAVKLPVQTAIIVPSTKGTNKPITAKQFDKRITNTRKEMSNMFGGFTSVASVGGFTDSKNRVVKEQTNVVVAFTDKETFEDKKDDFIEYSLLKRDEWEQENLGLLIEGDLFFV